MRMAYSMSPVSTQYWEKHLSSLQHVVPIKVPLRLGCLESFRASRSLTFDPWWSVLAIAHRCNAVRTEPGPRRASPINKNEPQPSYQRLWLVSVAVAAVSEVMTYLTGCARGRRCDP